jgi:hypothetical protein
MFKLYYAAAIDTCVDKAFKQIEEFKKLFNKHTIYFKNGQLVSTVKNPIEVFGAGFNDSPIIGPETSSLYKGVISSYDFRVLRGCDILLVVTDLKQFAAGTFMELEYARNLGIYTILFVLPEDTGMDNYVGSKVKYNQNGKLKNIFLETYANKIIYSMKELEDILKDLTQ